MAAEIEIRRLTPDDAQVFYLLRLEALENEPSAFSASPEEHHAMTVQEIAQRLGDPNTDNSNFVLGAFAGDRLIGMAGFFQDRGPKRQHKARVWGVYINKDWRRQGVARVLLSEIIERARSRPEVEQILLSVVTEQVAAKHLYQSMGFEIYGREPSAIKLGNGYFDEYQMLLRLR